MDGYAGLKDQKNKIGTTLLIVLGIHVVLAGGLVWLASTSVGQKWLKVYKVRMVNVMEKTLEPPPLQKPPEEEAPPPPPPEPEAADLKPAVEPPAPEPSAPPPVTSAQPVKLPGFGNPFSGGKGKRFSGYTDLVTSEIQRLYKQPPELPEDLRLAVLCQLLVDAEGQVLGFKLLNSSGNDIFDRSAIQALSQLKRLRPPPQEMSRVIVVRFFPPSS
jgi:protein TonB